MWGDAPELANFQCLLIFSAIADFTVMFRRSKVISYTQPIVQIHNRLFIKNPTNAYNYVAYIEPFHYTTWITIGIFCVLTPLFLYLATKYSIFKFLKLIVLYYCCLILN